MVKEGFFTCRGETRRYRGLAEVLPAAGDAALAAGENSDSDFRILPESGKFPEWSGRSGVARRRRSFLFSKLLLFLRIWKFCFPSHGGRRLRSGEARKTSAREGPKAGPRRGFSTTPLFFVTFRDPRANGGGRGFEIGSFPGGEARDGSRSKFSVTFRAPRANGRLERVEERAVGTKHRERKKHKETFHERHFEDVGGA